MRREHQAAGCQRFTYISEHGFALHKGTFRDALCLWYGWHPGHLPTKCVCSKQFMVDYTLSCLCGGLPSLRHNEIRDVTADLLIEVCHNVSTEPELVFTAMGGMGKATKVAYMGEQWL